jgi:uncharacterized protein
MMTDGYIGDYRLECMPTAAMPATGGLKMKDIHIDQIDAAGLDLRFETQAQEFPILAEMIARGECDILAPIQTAIRAVRIAGRVDVEGEVRTTVALSCGRCLKAFQTALSSHFALTFTNRSEDIALAAEPDDLELHPEEINRIYYQGEKINLQEALQEQVVMAFPIRALCSETCRGLCPQCGADLNAGDCGCSPQTTDSRFAGLKKLNLQ